MSRLRALSVLPVLAVLAACADVTAPPSLQVALAKGGGGGGGGGGVAVPTCATVTVTNNAPTVRNLRMPEIRYNLENCGTQALAVTVTVTEWASAWSGPCPSPVAAPAQFALTPGQKLSSTFPVYRGPCGFTSNINGVLVQGVNRWQGHNLRLTVTDDATGAVLGSSTFSWQDELPNGP